MFCFQFCFGLVWPGVINPTRRANVLVYHHFWPRTCFALFRTCVGGEVSFSQSPWLVASSCPAPPHYCDDSWPCTGAPGRTSCEQWDSRKTWGLEPSWTEQAAFDPRQSRRATAWPWQTSTRRQRPPAGTHQQTRITGVCYKLGGVNDQFFLCLLYKCECCLKHGRLLFKLSGNLK